MLYQGRKEDEYVLWVTPTRRWGPIAVIAGEAASRASCDSMMVLSEACIQKDTKQKVKPVGKFFFGARSSKNDACGGDDG